MITQARGILEIDHDRGVVYFHTDDEELAAKYGSVSLLRICGLGSIPERALDITIRPLVQLQDRSHGVLVSYA